MPLILGTNSIKDTGYNVANSYMFGGDANTAITNTTPTSTKIFTISLWIKFHEFPTSSGDRIIYGYYSADNTQSYLYLRNDFTLGFYEVDGGTSKIDFRTTQFFRDPTAWFHIMVAIDTSQGTNTNRFKLYVNGSQVSTFNANSYPDQNYASMLNENSLAFNVGGTGFSSSKINASICEFVFIDGSQLTPTSFGEFDSDSPNIWKPKDVSSLTFGNNGFYLEFKETGTSANSSGAGADTSGNNRHHSVTNLAATDQRTDTCTNNFATLNSLHNLSGTLSEGNLKYATSDGYGSHSNTATSTIGVSSGRWYAEFKCGGTTGSYPNGMVGVYYDSGLFQDGKTNPAQSDDEGWGYAENGNIYNNSSTATGTTYTDGDIIGVFLDCEGDKVYFYKNGSIVNSGGTSIDAGETYFFFIADTSGSGGTTFEANFGSPMFSISSTNADGNGYGSFEYNPVISSVNYYSLNTKNLAEFG